MWHSPDIDQAGAVLAEQFPDDVEGLVSGIEGYIQGQRHTGSLYSPLQPLRANGSRVEPHRNVSDDLF